MEHQQEEPKVGQTARSDLIGTFRRRARWRLGFAGLSVVFAGCAADRGERVVGEGGGDAHRGDGTGGFHRSCDPLAPHGSPRRAATSVPDGRETSAIDEGAGGLSLPILSCPLQLIRRTSTPAG